MLGTRRSLALVAGSAALGLAILVFSGVAWFEPRRQAWPGFRGELKVETRGARLVIKHVLPRSPAAQLGLRAEDEITAIGGVRLVDSARIAEAARRLQPGKPVDVALVRDGRESSVSLTPENALRKPHVVATVLLNLVAGIAFIAVGAFVYLSRPGDTRALVFHGMSCAFGFAALFESAPMHSYTLAPSANVVPLTGVAVCAFLLFPLLLHFCLIFPSPRPSFARHRHLLGWLYGIPAAELALLAAFGVAGLVSAGAGTSTVVIAPLKELAGAARPYLGVILAVLFAALIAPLCQTCARLWRAIREDGIRSTIGAHPGLVIAAAVLIPLFMAVAGQGAGMLFGVPGLARAAIVAALVLLAASCAVCLAAHWFGFPVAACIALYRSYRSARGDDRQQIRWPLWGVSLAVAAHLFAVPVAMLLLFIMRLPADSISYGVMYYGADHVKIASLLLIPLSFSFSILRYRLMEIDLYIRKTAIYGAATGLLGLVYIALVGSSGAMVGRWSGVRGEWFTAGATLVVAAAFVPVRNRMQSVLDEKFFRKRDYAAALQALTREIGQTRTPSSLAEAAADRVQRAFQCRSVSIQLKEARGWTAAAQVGSDAEALAISIVHRGTELGRLSVGGRLSDEQYDTGDRQFLGAVADQIAVGLENMRMEREQREIESAREIQQGLLPTAIPRAPGVEIAAAWQPARSVGGDYYDVLDLGGGRLGMIVADVSGKGIPAALLMSNLQAAAKVFAKECESPAAFARRINEVVCGNVTPGRFITMFYGVLDAPGERIVYSNAGHNAPILCRASGEVVLMDRGGPVLGISRRAEYEQGEIPLGAGDRLLLFTDGVSEAFGDEDEQFGEERLVQLLRDWRGGADGLKATVLNAVTEFCHGDFSDDATLIAVTVARRAEAAMT